MLPETNDKITQENVDKIKKEMTLAEVEAILGKGKPATIADVRDACSGLHSSSVEDRIKRWTPKCDQNAAFRWQNGRERVLIAFTTPPAQGGKVQALLTRLVEGGNLVLNDIRLPLLSSGGGGEESRGGGGDSGPRPAASVTVTAEQLAGDYAGNKGSADGKYKDRWLNVEGPLEDIDLSYLGGCTVRLKGSKPPPGKLLGKSIRCVIPEAQMSRALGLTRGQKVKVKGKCSGETASLFIDLLEGEIVDTGPDPAVPVSAARLAQDYAGNEQAADARYKDKELLVTGVLEEHTKDRIGVLKVVLRGATKKTSQTVKVVAAYPAEWKDRFAKLKPGDRIKVKGECSGYWDGKVSINRCWLVP
jgi:hypothetical protein